MAYMVCTYYAQASAHVRAHVCSIFGLLNGSWLLLCVVDSPHIIIIFIIVCVVSPIGSGRCLHAGRAGILAGKVGVI